MALPIKPSDVLAIVERENERIKAEHQTRIDAFTDRFTTMRAAIKDKLIEQIPIHAVKTRDHTWFTVPYPKSVDPMKDIVFDKVADIAREAVHQLNEASGDDAAEFVYVSIRNMTRELTFDVRAKGKKKNLADVAADRGEDRRLEVTKRDGRDLTFAMRKNMNLSQI